MVRVRGAWILIGAFAATACGGEVVLGGEQDAGSGGGEPAAVDDGGGNAAGSGGGGAAAMPVVMAAVPSPAEIAVDSTNLYWASYTDQTQPGDTPVGEIPLAAGPGITLDGISANAIAIDADRVYTVSPVIGNAPPGLVVACAKTGCGGKPTTLASGQGQVLGIAVDDANVYWTHVGSPPATGTVVMRAPVGGGSATALVTGTYATAIAVAAGSVYFVGKLRTGEASLWTVPVAGGTPTNLVQGNAWIGVSTVTVDATNAYFAMGDGTIGKIPLAGGASTMLAPAAGPVVQQPPTGPMGIVQLAVDATRVYWADPLRGTIQSVAIDGGPVSTLASGQYTPIGIAVDATSVYWSNRDGANGVGQGTIMKIAK